jgi:hypothetical protein
MAYLDASAKQLSEWLGLPGSGTIEFILADLDRDPNNASKVAAGVVRALLS